VQQLVSTSKITIRGEASFSNNNPLLWLMGCYKNNNSVLILAMKAACWFSRH